MSGWWLALLVLLVALNQNEVLAKWHGFVKDLPEEHMSVPEMIRYHGYPCESHNVTTEDGYILTVHRIPYGRLRNSSTSEFPVFLQHGFLDSSATWTMNLPTQSLAFILADSGYDVWMGNSRGNVYSRQHKKWTTDDAQFWDFSFDEMAKYDIPSCIDYVLNVTQSTQIHYVGHSQGTTLGFIAFENEEITSKVKTFVALAPVATVKNIKGAIKVIVEYKSEIEFLFKELGVREFFPPSGLTKFIAQKLCGASEPELVCSNIIFLFAGYDTSNLNNTRIPVYLSHLPSGTSVKDLYHFMQMVERGKFCMYDYGEKNEEIYNQAYPPYYNVSAVRVPLAIFYGGRDWLADVDDVHHSILPYIQNTLVVNFYATWNHLDFVWGEEAGKYLYNEVLNVLSR